MNSKYSYLSKNIVLFAISGFVPKLLAFFLVPLYTSFLTPGEYGVSDLITTTVSLMLPIFTLDIQDAVMRFALDREYDQKDVFTSAVRIVLWGTVLVALGALAAAGLKLPGLKQEYLFFFVVTFFCSGMNSSISLFCRGIDRVGVMVVGSILNSAVCLTANLLFLAVLHWGLTGYLLANLLGALASLVYCFFGARLYRYLHWHSSPRTMKSMIDFSFPLIFNVIAWWINNASDRYILTWISGVAASGLLAVAYKIPTLLSVFQNVFSQAWSISAIKEFNREDSDGFIGNTYAMIHAGMVIVCSGLMMFTVPLAKLLFANQFFAAWRLVPPLLLSVVFNAMSLFIGSIFTAVKDTKTLSASTVAGAAVNTVCNFVFIRQWGAYGAAAATAVGYSATLLMRHLVLRKHIRMRIHFRRDLLVYGLLCLQIAAAYFGTPLILVQCIVFVLILGGYHAELSGFASILLSLIRT